MDPVRAAIKTLLNNGGVSPVYSPKPPQGTSSVFPCVTVRKQGGADVNAFAGPPIENNVWLVKAISQNMGEAEDLNIEAFGILHRAKLALTGYHNQLLVRIGPVSYETTEDGELYYHEGGEYRVITEEES